MNNPDSIIKNKRVDICDSVLRRFFSYIEVEESTGAWKWKGGKTSSGYGAFWFNGKTVSAHRFAYKIINGPIPDRIQVCHKYEHLGRDNVNPGHLFLGTGFDNMRDAASKHRTAHGTKNGQCKLTEQDVAEIRKSSKSCLILSKEYGVSGAKISQIRRGVSWQHVPHIVATTHSLRNKSGYRGVAIHQKGYRASITIRVDGRPKVIGLGLFKNPVMAAIAFDAAAIKYRGESAKVNFAKK